jgi:hypothetical protein
MAHRSVPAGLAIVVALLALGVAPPARAQTGPGKRPPPGQGEPAAPAPSAPRRVEIGCYVNQIPSMNLHDNRFEVDFFLWFRWKGKDLDPLRSFQLVSGQIDSKDQEFRATRGDIEYACVRVKATIVKFWDVRDYPLDRHELAIDIEDNENESDKLVYVSDLLNSSISPDLRVPGYVIKRAFPQVAEHTYRTNYGDPDLPADSPSTYSRFTYTVEIARPGFGIFTKLFLALFLSVILSFLAFLIKPTNVDPRFGLGIGAIFAAVSIQYVIEAALPEVDQVTLADKLHKIAIAFILATIAESVLSLRLVEIGKEEASKVLDRISLVLACVFYAASTVFVVYHR